MVSLRLEKWFPWYGIHMSLKHHFIPITTVCRVQFFRGRDTVLLHTGSVTLLRFSPLCWCWRGFWPWQCGRCCPAAGVRPARPSRHAALPPHTMRTGHMWTNNRRRHVNCKKGCMVKFKSRHGSEEARIENWEILAKSWLGRGFFELRWTASCAQSLSSKFHGDGMHDRRSIGNKHQPVTRSLQMIIWTRKPSN